MEQLATKALTDERDFREKYKKQVIDSYKEYMQKIKDSEGMAATLDKLLVKLKYDGSVLYSNGVFTLYITTDGFTSEAAPKLLNLLEGLEELFGEDWSIIDDAAINSRLYKNRGGVSVYVTIRADGQCTRAIVGSRKVQKRVTIDTDEPIYTFKC